MGPLVGLGLATGCWLLVLSKNGMARLLTWFSSLQAGPSQATAVTGGTHATPLLRRTLEAYPLMGRAVYPH